MAGLLAIGMLLFASLAPAQDTPRLEVFGGYSLLHSEPRFQKDLNGHGWEASIAGNLNHVFGIVADIGRHRFAEDANGLTDISASTSSLMFGPQFTWRSSRRLAPFGRALVGIVRVKSSIGPGSSFPETRTPFAFALGGGVDYGLSRRIALRVAQIEYFGTKSEQTEGFRVAAGVVLRLR